jgi:uncharacterized membrane protein YfcA
MTIWRHLPPQYRERIPVLIIGWSLIVSICTAVISSFALVFDHNIDRGAAWSLLLIAAAVGIIMVIFAPKILEK